MLTIHRQFSDLLQNGVRDRQLETLARACRRSVDRRCNFSFLKSCFFSHSWRGRKEEEEFVGEWDPCMYYNAACMCTYIYIRTCIPIKCRQWSLIVPIMFVVQTNGWHCRQKEIGWGGGEVATGRWEERAWPIIREYTDTYKQIYRPDLSRSSPFAYWGRRSCTATHIFEPPHL